jgi:hypothetical protein
MGWPLTKRGIAVLIMQNDAAGLGNCKKTLKELE